jgi:hypothetical protein
MSIDDFFEKIDQDIESIDAKNKAHVDKMEKLELFLDKAIQDIAPNLRQYEQYLKDKNINYKLSINRLSFSLIMYYKDGGHSGIIFGQERLSRDPYYTFMSTFTNEDGKNYIATNAVPITENNWSIELINNEIQKAIKDFLFYASRHGGF